MSHQSAALQNVSHIEGLEPHATYKKAYSSGHPTGQPVSISCILISVATDRVATLSELRDNDIATCLPSGPLRRLDRNAHRQFAQICTPTINSNANFCINQSHNNLHITGRDEFFFISPNPPPLHGDALLLPRVDQKNSTVWRSLRSYSRSV